MTLKKAVKPSAINETYDLAVIGGGPAGMIAAGRAAELGARVLLVEKNDRLGKKLIITGGGRCNVTNAEFDTRKLISKYGEKGKFLFSPFAKFGVKETIEFFESRDMPIKVEAENRAFPESNRAESVFEVLDDYIKKGNVTVMYNSAVTGFEVKDGKVTGVKTLVATSTKEKSVEKLIEAKSFILATGGKSRPETGSTGDGFTWLAKIGHKITEPDAALVPVKIKNDWVKELQGLALQDVRLSVFQDGIRQNSQIGKMLFTHFGLSGPLVLNMSREMKELFNYGEVSLTLDLFPTLNHQELDQKLQDIWKIEQNKLFKNSLKKLILPKLAPVAAKLSGIDPEIFVNKISREDRLKLIKLLKEMRMSVSGFLGEEKAIVTSGGVALEEVDFKTMQSRLFPNLYLVGDILDFDRPSGGFSLQICWSTGYIAGENAIS